MIVKYTQKKDMPDAQGAWFSSLPPTAEKRAERLEGAALFRQHWHKT